MTFIKLGPSDISDGKESSSLIDRAHAYLDDLYSDGYGLFLTPIDNKADFDSLISDFVNDRKFLDDALIIIFNKKGGTVFYAIGRRMDAHYWVSTDGHEQLDALTIATCSAKSYFESYGMGSCETAECIEDTDLRVLFTRVKSTFLISSPGDQVLYELPRLSHTDYIKFILILESDRFCRERICVVEFQETAGVNNIIYLAWNEEADLWCNHFLHSPGINQVQSCSIRNYSLRWMPSKEIH